MLSIPIFELVGVVSTIVGSGASSSLDGIGIAASMSNPRGICVDSTGNIFFSEGSPAHKIRRVVIATGNSAILVCNSCS